MKKITPLAEEMANRIKSIREALGYSQEAFSEKVGISIGTIKTVETLVHNPSIDTLVKLSKFLNISLDELVFGSKNETSSSTPQFQNNHKKIGDLTIEQLISILDQSVDNRLTLILKGSEKKKETPDFTKEEVKIIELLREKPHYASTIVKLLTPSNATTNNTTVSLPPKVDVAVRKRAK